MRNFKFAIILAATTLAPFFPATAHDNPGIGSQMGVADMGDPVGKVVKDVHYCATFTKLLLEETTKRVKDPSRFSKFKVLVDDLEEMTKVFPEPSFDESVNQLKMAYKVFNKGTKQQTAAEINLCSAIRDDALQTNAEAFDPDAPLGKK